MWYWIAKASECLAAILYTVYSVDNILLRLNGEFKATDEKIYAHLQVLIMLLLAHYIRSHYLRGDE
jgi:hypothetical protein